MKKFRMSTFFFAGVMLAILAIIAWLSSHYRFYEAKENLSGIWVEVHGVIIEFILISLLFGWFLQRREFESKKDILTILYVDLFDDLHKSLNDLLENYIRGEKQYVHFGNNTCLTRKLPEDYKFFIISRDKEAAERIVLSGIRTPSSYAAKYKSAVQELIEELGRIKYAALMFFEIDLSHLLIETESKAKEYVAGLERLDLSKADAIEELMENKLSIVLQILRLKSSIESKADSVESREHYWQNKIMLLNKLKRQINLVNEDAENTVNP